MNLLILAMLFVPLIAIPFAHFLSKKVSWTDLATSLVVGCLGMIILGLISFVLSATLGFWALWAFGGVTSFASAWLTLYSSKNF